MSFFYDLNKKLDGIRATPEVTHQQLNERGEKWIQKAVDPAHKGDLHKALHVPQGEKIPKGKINKAAHSKDSHLRHMAQFAKNVAKEDQQVNELSPDTLNSYADKAKGQRSHAFGRMQAAQQGNQAADPTGKFAKTWDKRATGYNKAVAKGANDLDKSGTRSTWNYDQDMEEGVMDTVKSVGKRVASGINKLVGHGSDEDMIKDLQRKSGAPVTGKKPTFADKIANAKKEVDEMLGDVAAEAIKTALSPKQKKIDMNKNGKLDANDFAMLRKGAKSKSSGEMDEERSKGTAFDLSTPRDAKPKVGSVERGHKHDIKHTATGRMVTRRTDDQGHSVGADDDSEASGEKRGRGRPKGTKQSIGAKGPSGKSKLMTKESDVDVTDQGEYDQEGDMAKDDIKTIVRHAQALHKILGDDDNLPEWVQSKLAKIEGMMISIDEYMQNQQGDDGEEQELDEKAVSKAQQKFMGMAHAMQKGEKIPGASKELKKVAKTMKKKDVEDFAKTKHKGLPEKVKSKKKEEDVEESSTTAGSVATSTATTGGKGGVFGKGIYDSMNRELEKMIAESMSINMSDSTEGGKSLTVTATDEDAMKLAVMLKSAGLGGQGRELQSDDTCPTCGSTDCGCGDVHEAVDENAPDWPTSTETSDDALQYAGGLNKPKASGMATIPVTDMSLDGEDMFSKSLHEDELRRMMEMAGIKQAELEPWKETMKEEADDVCSDCHKDPCVCDESVEESIQRMREIAGIKEAKKDVEEEKTEEGNLFTGNLAKARADGKKEADLDGDGDMEKVRESIFTLTNQWKAYRG